VQFTFDYAGHGWPSNIFNFRPPADLTKPIRLRLQRRGWMLAVAHQQEGGNWIESYPLNLRIALVEVSISRPDALISPSRALISRTRAAISSDEVATSRLRPSIARAEVAISRARMLISRHRMLVARPCTTSPGQGHGYTPNGGFVYRVTFTDGRGGILSTWVP
jgi:hypothetical protein